MHSREYQQENTNWEHKIVFQNVAIFNGGQRNCELMIGKKIWWRYKIENIDYTDYGHYWYPIRGCGTMYYALEPSRGKNIY